MERDSERCCGLGDVAHAGGVCDAAACKVVRVLNHHKPGRRVDVGVGAGGAANMVAIEVAIVADLEGLDAGDGSRSARLEEHHVRVARNDDAVAPPAVAHERELVCHGSAGGEHGVGHSEEGGDAEFERADGRVFAEDVVTYRSGGDGSTHGGCGLRDSVAAEVAGDHGLLTLQGQVSPLAAGLRRSREAELACLRGRPGRTGRRGGR